MNFEIDGTIAQYATLSPELGESFWCSRGSLMSYTSGVTWRLRAPGGLEGALRRTFAGEGIALVWVETQDAGQVVRLASNSPGHVQAWDLADGPVIATRGSFLAAWGPHIDISMTIARRAGAAFFGGAGLFLQRVSGEGTVLVHASGDYVREDLAAGEQMLISSGNLAAFSDSIDYSIQGVGGCLKMLFGGEGIFMTRLEGPGAVLLQSLKRRSGASAAAASAAAS